jgi:hypothetical protein
MFLEEELTGRDTVIADVATMIVVVDLREYVKRRFYPK